MKSEEEVKSTLSVAIRVRPLNEREKSNGQSFVWKIRDNTIEQTWQKSNSKRKLATYDFDRVFGPTTKNDEVYDKVVKDIVKKAMEGYHCSVFAYGQTSCGKTHTIHGTKSSRGGVVQMAVRDMFSYIRGCPSREFLLRVSYMEIYNEKVNDLLVPSSTNLHVFEHRKKGVMIKGLLEEVVTSPERIQELLRIGGEQRKFASTKYNERSSRSHTLLRIVIESKSTSENKGPVRVSTLSLTDLAGSESLRISGAEGSTRKEGAYINKSLLTLSMVIRALSNKNKNAIIHIPYRQSKLTRILQPSLSGNAQVGVICCVTPGSSHVMETINTLDFAARAKTIESTLKVNEVIDEHALLKRYRQEIEELKLELAKVKDVKDMDLLGLSSNASSPSVEGAEEEMREIEDMISRLNHVILSANSMTPTATSSSSSLLGGTTRKRKKSPRFRRRSGSFNSVDVDMIDCCVNDDDDDNDDVVDRPPSHLLTLPEGKQLEETSPSKATMDELERVKQKLASLYEKKSTSASRRQLFSNTRSKRERSNSKEVKSLKAELSNRELVTSVHLADSAFLQKQIKERDEMIQEMMLVMDAMEKRVNSITKERDEALRELSRCRDDVKKKQVAVEKKKEKVVVVEKKNDDEGEFDDIVCF
jgi:centromeric protein E